MEDVKYQAEKILQDFEEFERAFLQPYNPNSADLLCTPNPSTPFRVETRVSWFEQLEMNFVNAELSDSIFHSSDFKSPVADYLCFDQTINNSKPVSFDPNPLDLQLLKPHKLREDVPDTQLSVTHADNSRITNPVIFDDLPPFDPAVLALIDFDFPTNPDKSDSGDMRIFQEIKEDKVCSKGKCWGYGEGIWGEVQKIPRGRKKKGFDLSPQLRHFCKERQKIKNRISATKCYTRVKAYIHDLEVQVTRLQAENKIRRNSVQFLRSSLQQQQRKQSLSRTMSGPL
ncbi:uncharacterized protein LOC141656344 [Silene latifolia]|uniref:uncharacterized protein LOC141656344 n=1 Tax=Silene latifolia TaxID=37657 RepID=UPI003D779354